MRGLYMWNRPSDGTDKSDYFPKRPAFSRHPVAVPAGSHPVSSRHLMRFLVSVFTLLVIPFSLLAEDFPKKMNKGG